MADLILPDNITEATTEYVEPEQAVVDGFAMVAMNREIKRLDPRLSVLFAQPGAKAFPKGGRWYIVRKNEMTVDSYWLVEDEHGEYSPVTERHIARLMESDAATNPRLAERYRDQYAERMKRAEKAMQEKRREFREKLQERLDFNYRTQVRVTPEMKDRA